MILIAMPFSKDCNYVFAQVTGQVYIVPRTRVRCQKTPHCLSTGLELIVEVYACKPGIYSTQSSIQGSVRTGIGVAQMIRADVV